MLFGLFTRKNIKNLSDQELISRLVEGDRHAEGELFIRYSPLVMGLCLKYMKSVPLAEDMMMGLFEKLPKKISNSTIENFKNWLFSVSRNECLMELRKKKIDTADFETSLLFAEDEGAADLESTLQKEAELEKVEFAIDELKNEQKKCIQLFYLKKASYDQIVAETGYELKKVKSYIQNGKRNLKIILENKSES
jgi:RNA polymerase sigma-70 factor, ECF subfamily